MLQCCQSIAFFATEALVERLFLMAFLSLTETMGNCSEEANLLITIFAVFMLLKAPLWIKHTGVD